MPYSISTGDYIESQLVWNLFSQTCRTVFHWRLEAGGPLSDGAAALQSFLSAWETQLWGPLQSRVSADLRLSFLTAQVVTPFRYRLEKRVPGNPLGTGAVPAVPPSSTVNVQRWAQRSGRKFQGRVYFPGLPVTSSASGQLSPMVLPAWNLLIGPIINDVVVGAVTWSQYLNYKGVDVGLQHVVNGAVDPILRSQRRREIGKGE